MPDSVIRITAEDINASATLQNVAQAERGVGVAAEEANVAVASSTAGVKAMGEEAVVASSGIAGLGETLGLTVANLGLLGAGAMVVGTAIAAWDIGKKIGEWTGLTDAIEHATEALFGWDTAQETAAAKQDVINKAIAEGADKGINYGDAIRYVNAHAAEQNKLQSETNEAWEEYAVALAYGGASLDGVSMSTRGLVKEMVDLEMSPKKIVAAMLDIAPVTVAQVDLLVKGWKDEAEAAKQAAAQVKKATEEHQRFVDSVQSLVGLNGQTGKFSPIGAFMSPAYAGIGDMAIDQSFGIDAATAAALPGGANLPSTPLVGYGSRFGAGSAYAPYLIPPNASVPSSTTSPSPFGNVGRDIRMAEGAIGFLSSPNEGLGRNLLSGAETGAEIGMVAGPVGAAIGGAVGLVAGGIKSLFGGPSQDEKDGRQTEAQFEQQMGGLDGMQKALMAAGLTADQTNAKITALWNAEKQGASAVQTQIDGINGTLNNQKTAYADLTSLVQKYGLSEEELGPALQRQQLDQQSQQLYKDFSELAAAGVDVSVITGHMADGIQAYYLQAKKTGTEIPAAMQPMLQQMVDMGKLTDENGTVITDLKTAGVTFSETMTQGFHDIVDSVHELTSVLSHDLGGQISQTTNQLNGIPKTIDVAVDYSSSFPTFDGTGDGSQSFANEGYDINRPTRAIVGDAPGDTENVVRSSSIRQLFSDARRIGAAASSSDLESKIDALHQTISRKLDALTIALDPTRQAVAISHAMRGTR